MLIELAVTAPVESAGPRAVTHSPTLRVEALADCSWVTVVLDEVVTVMSLVLGVVVVVVDEDLPFAGRRNPFRSIPFTTKPEVDTDVTLPNVVANWGIDPLGTFPRGPPPGKEPEPGVRPAKRKPPPAPNPPAAPPAPGPVQVPLEPGKAMLIDRAVMGLVEDPDVAGVPETLTQSPTATLLSALVTVWVNVVEPVQSTVVWLLVLCTSMDGGVNDATWPTAPGAGAVVVGLVPEAAADGVPDDPQAEAAIASPARARTVAEPWRRVLLSRIGGIGSLSPEWSVFGGLLIAKGVDWCQSGRSGGGVDPEPEAHCHGDYDGTDGGRH